MRPLCDHNVDERYIDTFRRTEWLTVATVRDELSQEAADRAISEYTERQGWVPSIALGIMFLLAYFIPKLASRIERSRSENNGLSLVD